MLHLKCTKNTNTVVVSLLKLITLHIYKDGYHKHPLSFEQDFLQFLITKLFALLAYTLK